MYLGSKNQLLNNEKVGEGLRRLDDGTRGASGGASLFVQEDNP